LDSDLVFVGDSIDLSGRWLRRFMEGDPFQLAVYFALDHSSPLSASGSGSIK
jgi:hypothetical protein